MKNKLQFETLAKIDVGGTHHQQLIKDACIRDPRIRLTGWGIEIMEKTNHLQHRFQVELVSITLRRHLPIVSKERTLRPMIMEGFANGLCLCPSSVGLESLVQLPQGFLRHEVILAMHPVFCTGLKEGVRDAPNLLSIEDRKREGNYPKGHWMLKQPVTRTIHGTPACLDSFADGGMTYLFCRRIPVLVKAGYAELSSDVIW